MRNERALFEYTRPCLHDAAIQIAIVRSVHFHHQTMLRRHRAFVVTNAVEHRFRLLIEHRKRVDALHVVTNAQRGVRGLRSHEPLVDLREE